MPYHIRKTPLEEILFLRSLYLQENNFQVRYDARHRRGWTDSYLISLDDRAVGYGAVAGKQDHAHRDSLFEFYVLPSFRAMAAAMFVDLVRLAGVADVTCQTNDRFFTQLVYRFAVSLRAEAYLFSDHHVTDLRPAGLDFRKRGDGEVMEGYDAGQMGSYVAVREGRIVGTGDFYLHYNPPFADLWMEVMAAERRQGIGSFVLQELKKECYLAGRVPAARCNIDNAASKACLLKAGLEVAGCMVSGEVNAALLPQNSGGHQSFFPEF